MTAPAASQLECLGSRERFVEAMQCGQAAIEEVERRAFFVMAMHPVKDKWACPRVGARYIKNGAVRFLRTEKHNDLVDALSSEASSFRRTTDACRG